MRIRAGAVLFLLVLPAAASAQAVAALSPLYENIKGNLIKSADQMAEADYAFKPTPAVRSFGQLVGHMANANFAICSTAKGEKSPATQDFEKVTEKAALVKALRDAFAYCDAVFKLPDASFSPMAELFGMKMSRLSFLMLNVAHDNEHYGNMVTYFRLKGMVPPSSQGG
ncbi:MAG TPA: DinB family protein [Gemmatimonadales bacterium]|jgi:uncharacterized damage-inducible protein DinB|nr:DinB family protein [Gemmatimonadales bacterium]